MAENYSLEISASLKDYFTPNVAKINESINSISKNTNNITKQFGGLNSIIGSVGSNWKTALAGMASAAAGFLAANKVKDFFIDIAKAANEKQQAIANLANTMGVYNKELITQAEELEKTTLYSNEATIGAQAMLATYVRNADQLKILTPLVQDFAAKTGQDLNTAARMVSQSFAGTNEGIGKYKANINGAAGSNERFNSIVENMNKLFGGSAKIAAEVGTGPLQVMQNRIESIKDDIGEQLLPYLKQFSEYILNNIDTIKMFLDSTVKVSLVLVQLGKSIYHFSESAISGFSAIIEFIMGSVVEFIHNVYRKVLQSTDIVINTFNSVRSKITGTKYDHSDLANTMAGEYSYLKTVSNEFWNSNVKHAQNADKAFGKSIEDLYNIGNIFKKQAEFIPKVVGGKGKVEFANDKTKAGVKNNDGIEKIYSESLKRMKEMIPEANKIRNELLYGSEQDETAKLDAQHRAVMQQLQIQLDEQLSLAKNNKELKLQLQKEYTLKEQIENEKYYIKYNQIQNDILQADQKRSEDKLKLQKEQGVASSKELLSGLVSFTSANEKYKALYKSAAIAETLIATYSGATKAASSVATIPGVGWSMAPFIAAGHIALGLANVARISGIKMQYGGVVPGNSFNGDKIHTQLNSGELVMSPSMQANTLAAIGYGQKTTNNSSSNVNLSVTIDNSQSTTNGVSLDNLADAMLELHRSKKLDKFLYKIGVNK
jgi:hypothetical protein